MRFKGFARSRKLALALYTNCVGEAQYFYKGYYSEMETVDNVPVFVNLALSLVIPFTQTMNLQLL